jgi:hypothetical protein
MAYGNWATVKEAAEHYGVTRQRIHQLMAKGSLGTCRKVEGFGHVMWLIPYPFSRSTVMAIGRPKKEVKG